MSKPKIEIENKILGKCLKHGEPLQSIRIGGIQVPTCMKCWEELRQIPERRIT